MATNGRQDRRIHGPLRLGNINDASHISGHSLYAQEAKMVLLQADTRSLRDAPEWLSAKEAIALGGYGHPLYGTPRKATRVSHNTSHGESLSMLSGLQVAQLIANRMSEPFYTTYLTPRVPNHLIACELKT